MNIPYKIYGGLSFYQRKEIKDLLAYFRLTANQNDEEALKRVINYPKRGIGATSCTGRAGRSRRVRRYAFDEGSNGVPKTRAKTAGRAVRL